MEEMSVKFDTFNAGKQGEIVLIKIKLSAYSRYFATAH
jgi:hypothetical protein